MDQQSKPEFLNNLLTKAPGKYQYFDTGTMRIHGDVIEFKKKFNALEKIYRISNISSIAIIERPTPLFLIIFTVVCLVMCFPIAIFPIMQIVSIYRNPAFSMIIALNSGGFTSISSRDGEFLRSVAGVIRDIMNGVNTEGEIIINVDQRQISIAGSVHGSTIALGDKNNLEQATLPRRTDNNRDHTPPDAVPSTWPPAGNMPRTRAAARENVDSRTSSDTMSPTRSSAGNSPRVRPAVPINTTRTDDSATQATNVGTTPVKSTSGMNRIQQPRNPFSNKQED